MRYSHRTTPAIRWAICLIGPFAAALSSSAALAQTASLEMRITGTDGKPVERSSITLWQLTSNQPSTSPLTWTDPTTGQTWKPLRHWATSDHETATDLPAGDYRVTAALGTLQGAPIGISDVIHVNGAQPLPPVTVQIQTGPAMHIKTVDASTQSPITHTRIALIRWDGLPLSTWHNDSPTIPLQTGEISFPHLGPGIYTLRASKPAAVFDDPEYTLQDEPVRITLANTDQTVALKLQPSQVPQAEAEKRWPWVVFGKVTDANGKPMPGAQISVACGSGTLVRTGHSTSAADGIYTVRFGPGVIMYGANDPTKAVPQAATVSIQMPGHFEKNLYRQGDLAMAGEMPTDVPPLLKGKPTVLPGKPHQVNFILLPAMQLQGQLLDESGKPIPQHRIIIEGPDLPPSSGILTMLQTDDAGRFTCDSVPTGHPWYFRLREGPITQLPVDKPGPQTITLRLQPDRKMVVEVQADTTKPATR